MKGLVRGISAAALAFPWVQLADAVTPISDVVRMSAGGSHTCAILSAGGVKCWGYNLHGQLGTGATTSGPGLPAITKPVDVTGFANAEIAIAAGFLHTCALATGGGVKCWGSNTGGQLGDGSTTLRPAPVDVSGLTSGVAAITVGTSHSCALTTGGGVKCWGQNADGQLGDNSTTQRLTPVDVSGLSSGVAAIAAGSGHACALTTGGGVKCWGYNGSGQLGDNTTTNRLTPVDVSGLTSDVIAIAAGDNHACAVTSAGGVKCWGRNNAGQLGDNSTTRRLTPVDVSGLASGVSAISSGSSDTCALTSVGGVKCWGHNSNGQLGDNTTFQRLTPVDVVGLSSGVGAIAAGYTHTCALTVTGRMKCWGNNALGQIGDYSTTPRHVPTDVLTNEVRGDMNADRRADLFWRESAPGVGFSWWGMNGNAVSGSTYSEVDSSWQIADVGDLDGDGKADLVWRRASDGANYLWTLDGFGFKGFHDLGVLDPAAWSLVGTADLDSNGKNDIVWRGADGTIYGWLMDGGTIAAQGVISNPGTEWVIADLADMNGDGRADIVFRNANDGSVILYLMNGLAIASVNYVVGAVDPVAWTLVGVADFSGDDKGDFLWRHTTGDTWVWVMDEEVIQSVGGIGNPGAGWSVRALADLDGDGKTDLVWRHTDGTTYWWKMNGAAVAAYTPMTNPGGTWQIVAP